MAGVTIPGFEIFKEQIIESLVRDNKEQIMKKVAEQMRGKAIEELLCLPPNEEPSQDLANIISNSFTKVFYEETDVITSRLYEDENSIFMLVNDMNSGLAYLCDVDSDGFVHFNINRACMFDINSI